MVGVLRTCPEFSEDPCTEPPEAGNGIWRSNSGGAWESVPITPSMQNALSLDEIVAGSDRLAITGTARAMSPRRRPLWTSPDGTTWTESTDLGGLDPIDTLAAGPPGFVAFGTVARRQRGVRDRPRGDFARRTPFQRRSTCPRRSTPRSSSSVAGATGMSAVGYGDNEEFELSATALYSADGASLDHRSRHRRLVRQQRHARGPGGAHRIRRARLHAVGGRLRRFRTAHRGSRATAGRGAAWRPSGTPLRC